MNKTNEARKAIADYHKYSILLNKFGLRVDYDSSLSVSIIGECRSNLTDDMHSTDELKSFFYGYQAGVERTSKEAFINIDMVETLKSVSKLIDRIKGLEIKANNQNYEHFLMCAKKDIDNQLERVNSKSMDTK